MKPLIYLASSIVSLITLCYDCANAQIVSLKAYAETRNFSESEAKLFSEAFDARVKNDVNRLDQAATFRVEALTGFRSIKMLAVSFYFQGLSESTELRQFSDITEADIEEVSAFHILAFRDGTSPAARCSVTYHAVCLQESGVREILVSEEFSLNDGRWKSGGNISIVGVGVGRNQADKTKVPAPIK